MTAESTEHRVQWPAPPRDGYTVDDLSTLPDLPPHTGLIDGSLVFVSPQRRFQAAEIRRGRNPELPARRGERNKRQARHPRLELDPMTKAYVHMGMHRDRIKVEKPYPVDIDLTAIDQL